MRLRLLVAAVWLLHGLYNKLLGGSPRHLAIVQAVPGLEGAAGAHVLTAVGVAEVILAAWIVWGRARRTCAAAQTIGLLSMNALELAYARHLLLWPAGLLPLNAAFLALAWTAAGWQGPARLRRALASHPLAIQARLRDCLTLTFAVPQRALEPLLPPGLELETVDGCGFVAVALVQAEDLRPAHAPRALGRDVFLAGYRIVARFPTGSGRRLRGLQILRSDADRAAMVVAGNALTHYRYHRCAAAIVAAPGRLDVSVRTADGRADLDVSARLGEETVPPGSPFRSAREAMRFAGPLPFTFEYEPATRAMVVVRASRATWQPRPVAVDVRRIAFFDQPAFAGCVPRLAAAFHVPETEYRWHRGVRHAL